MIKRGYVFFFDFLTRLTSFCPAIPQTKNASAVLPTNVFTAKNLSMPALALSTKNVSLPDPAVKVNATLTAKAAMLNRTLVRKRETETVAGRSG